uniref:Uncharacterized protein n=1 Tax=Trypanosoma congolense (strain IL3000) TaxID=1068625 RepID=G0UJ18_TRYCI|nr:conserved hypothetical protein [Trypanosoma congolense IL3000]
MTLEKAEEALRLFASLQDIIEAEQDGGIQRQEVTQRKPSRAASRPSSTKRPTGSTKEKDLQRRLEAAESLARRLHEKNKKLTEQIATIESDANGTSGPSAVAESQSEVERLRGIVAEREAEMRSLRARLRHVERALSEKTAADAVPRGTSANRAARNSRKGRWGAGNREAEGKVVGSPYAAEREHSAKKPTAASSLTPLEAIYQQLFGGTASRVGAGRVTTPGATRTVG